MPELEKTELTLDEPEDSLRKQSQVKEVMKRLFRDRLAVVGMVIFAIYVLIAIFAPILTPYNYAEFSLVEKNQGMSWAHICGTDQYGRDIFSRLLYGTRYSLLLGLGAVVIGLTLGIILGCAAGYFGGWVETLIMRGCDVVQSIPGMLLAVIISVSLGIGVMQTIVALGIGRIALCCRMIRAQFLSQRKLEYVEAAQAT
ncbi:MAG: ABC transporter permease, partial [Oscillospiraceae bacterium]|nr:ABC transporter permease [Oscillospiraceae bacterium]